MSDPRENTPITLSKDSYRQIREMCDASIAVCLPPGGGTMSERVDILVEILHTLRAAEPDMFAKAAENIRNRKLTENRDLGQPNR